LNNRDFVKKREIQYGSQEKVFISTPLEGGGGPSACEIQPRPSRTMSSTQRGNSWGLVKNWTSSEMLDKKNEKQGNSGDGNNSLR